MSKPDNNHVLRIDTGDSRLTNGMSCKIPNPGCPAYSESGLSQGALKELEAKLLLTEGIRAFPWISEDTQIFPCQNES